MSGRYVKKKLTSTTTTFILSAKGFGPCNTILHTTGGLLNVNPLTNNDLLMYTSTVHALCLVQNVSQNALF